MICWTRLLFQKPMLNPFLLIADHNIQFSFSQPGDHNFVNTHPPDWRRRCRWRSLSISPRRRRCANHSDISADLAETPTWRARGDRLSSFAEDLQVYCRTLCVFIASHVFIEEWHIRWSQQQCIFLSKRLRECYLLVPSGHNREYHATT